MLFTLWKKNISVIRRQESIENDCDGHFVVRTCFIADGPNEQIDACSVRHYINLVFIDRNASGVTPLPLMVVLFILQFRLTDEKQSFHKLLHVLGEWRRQICNEFNELRHASQSAVAALTSLISQQFPQQRHQNQINRFGETLVAVRFDLMQ